ncbi:hypothetical protein As57867_005489, partial [Aphanomyces stellatus]
MGSGPRLSIEVRAAIRSFRKFNLSYRRISVELGRSKDTIRAYCKDPDGYGRPNPGQKPRIVVGRDERTLVRNASKTGASARSLHATLGLQGSIRTSQRRLQACKHLRYIKRTHTPCLKTAHKKARLDYATKNLREGTNWTEIIWSDEKKFNLDGPDGFKYYWHDLRKEKDTFFTRATGGASVMVWGAFSSAGLSELAFLEGTQNAEKYIDTLGNYLFPFGHANYGPTFTFMQDGASIHRAK